MKRLVLLLLIVPSLSVIGQNRLRVNNTGATGTNVYATFAAAHTAAIANDILIADHSDNDYDSPVITKPLTLYGPGYFLSENLALDSTQADSRPARIPTITFNAGSEGSVIQGMVLGDVFINANNITVSRCKITGQVFVGQLGNVQNPNINQCFIEGNETVAVRIVDGTNYVLANNLLRNENPSSADYTLQVDNGTGLVLNNIFYGVPKNQIKNATVQNNLFFFGIIDTVNSSNLTVNHNLSNLGFLNTFYGGLSNFNYASASYLPDSIVCFLMNPSPDIKYRLETNPGVTVTGGNPAVLGGADGKDMGMWGGAAPYRTSGMPPIPSTWFYQVQATGTQSGGVTVTVKSKSRT
ncbi:MAG: hypothetical protein JNM00_05050 [Flavobacteriales bacterium]|nr:hypothetical protein [Flavobacteriales bacterium]